MKTQPTPQEIINQYVETGVILTETTLSGDSKKGNVIAKKNRKVFNYLANDIELAKTILHQVMMCNIDNARAIAASDSLRLNILIEEAVEVLIEVSKRTDIIGFNAEMALKLWKGEIKGKTI